MGKLIFWLVVVFAVMLALRLYNTRKHRSSRQAEPARKVEQMVRCSGCGIYLPRSEASPVAGGFRCHDGSCAARSSRP
jgi:hypothetical protein